MAADAWPSTRRLLLLLVLVLPVTAALAGGVAASLWLRGQTLAPLPSPAVLQARGCEPAPSARPPADPLAALDAAMGRPMAIRTVSFAEAEFTTLLAPQPQPPPAPAPALAALPVLPAVAPAPPAPAPAPPALPPLVAGYSLDLGYFLVPEHAAAFAAGVQERGVPVQLRAIPDTSGRVWTHVRTPPFAGSAQALAGAEKLERGLGIPARLVPPEPAPTPGGTP